MPELPIGSGKEQQVSPGRQQTTLSPTVPKLIPPQHVWPAGQAVDPCGQQTQLPLMMIACGRHPQPTEPLQAHSLATQWQSGAGPGGAMQTPGILQSTQTSTPPADVKQHLPTSAQDWQVGTPVLGSGAQVLQPSHSLTQGSCHSTDYRSARKACTCKRPDRSWCSKDNRGQPGTRCRLERSIGAGSGRTRIDPRRRRSDTLGTDRRTRRCSRSTCDWRRRT